MKMENNQVENRESRARIGRTFTYLMHIGWDLDEIRKLHGPSLGGRAKIGKQPPNVFEDNRKPLQVTLSPDINMTDRYVKALASVDRARTIKLYAPPEHKNGADHFFDMQYSHIRDIYWGLSIPKDNREVAMPVPNPERLVPYVFGEATDPALALACYKALQAHDAINGELFVTQNETALACRFKGGFTKDLGIVTPKEAMKVVNLVLRSRKEFLLGFSRATYYANKGAYFDTMVQLLMPSYLRLYRGLVERGPLVDEACLYLEGTLVNLSQLLMAHDDLAIAHYGEGLKGANNDTVRDQQYASTNAILALTAVCEGLTWLIVRLSDQTPRKMSVSFRNLAREETSWTKNLGKLESIAKTLARIYEDPVVQALYALRDTIQHHMPVRTAVMGFGSTVDFRGHPRFSKDFEIGAILTGFCPPGGLPASELWIIADQQPEAAVLPYKFFTAASSSLIAVTEEVLAGISQALGFDEQLQKPYLAEDSDLSFISVAKECLFCG